MKNCWFFCVVLLSPSSRAEWVEIEVAADIKAEARASPSSRAEWVEIQATDITVEELRVSVLAGGVG